jgi:hypothetical protein
MVYIYIIVVFLPLCPSLFFILLSILAYRNNKKFLYYNLLFASGCNAFFLLWFLVWFFYIAQHGSREEGLVLLLLPFFALFFSIGSFLLGLLSYPFLKFKAPFWTGNEMLNFPFRVSFALTTLLVLFWVFQFFKGFP